MITARPTTFHSHFKYLSATQLNRRYSIGTSRPSGRPPLLDHLVGGGQQRFWDGEAERLGGLEVDDQLEFGRLFDGKVRRFCALENLPDVMEARSAVRCPDVGAVTHQTTVIGELATGIYRWNFVTCRQPQYLVAIACSKK